MIRALAIAAALAGVSQPPQPKGGALHAGVRVTAGGSGANAWYVFEPIRPRPRRAPLAIVTHGYYEFSGYASLAGLIRHSVVHDGDVVIYPRWQTGIADPCPGPFDITPCLRSEVAGIRGALAHLGATRWRRASYFGFSFGGIITADVLNHWRRYGVPRPRAVFLDDPHDGGLIPGRDEPALDASLAGIPSSTLFECHSGADGVIAEPGKAGMSCNALFPRLTSIPARNRELVMTHTDAHGNPVLSSAHGVCASGPTNPPNAYDWNFCWRDWDALQAGHVLRRRSLGRWSDGTPVTPLTIAGTG